MMKLLALPLVLHATIAFAQCYTVASGKEDTARFVITVNQKKGFINASGEVVIAPQYHAVTEFSEGLCAVRIEGRYGFIDTDGTLCIEPRYDYATRFQEGLALVFIEGHPFFIDKNGSMPFHAPYKTMTGFVDGRSYVRTLSGKSGIIDRQGSLVVDTLYSYIAPFVEEYAVVYGIEHVEYDSDDEKKNLQVSVIDISGRQLFPYGKYESIENYSEGYFRVDFPERKGGNVNIDAIINVDGEVVYVLPENETSWLQGGVHNGIVRVSLPLTRRGHDYYDAYVGLDGEFIYKNKNITYGKDFSENYAFVGNDDFDYQIIDRDGNLLTSEWYNRIAGDGFRNGHALVQRDQGWAVIDTTMRIVLQTSFRDIYEELIEDRYIAFSDTDCGGERSCYGLMDINGKQIIDAVMRDFNPVGFVNGLIMADVDGRIAYFNREGKLIWHDPVSEQVAPRPLNIDYMYRGYFCASSENTGHPVARWPSVAVPISMERNFREGVLNLVAYKNEQTPFYNAVAGMRITLANSTADTARFNAQDSRLYMKMQAKDKTGTWRDIEYLPSSWCGNSYHSVNLPPGHLWEFVAPIYEGEFATTLRVTVTYVDPTFKPENPRRERAYRHAPELTLYSNEFQGKINPGQFWRKSDYHPSGLMDPYND